MDLKTLQKAKEIELQINYWTGQYGAIDTLKYDLDPTAFNHLWKEMRKIIDEKVATLTKQLNNL